MGYRADLAIDLTFHSPADLATLSRRMAGADPTERNDPSRLAWHLFARLSEFADGRLEDLHLTGWGSGNLRTGHEQVIAALARYADGTVDGRGEDGHQWQIRLHQGTATLSPHRAGPGHPTVDLPQPRTPLTEPADHEPLAAEPIRAAPCASTPSPAPDRRPR